METMMRDVSNSDTGMASHNPSVAISVKNVAKPILAMLPMLRRVRGKEVMLIFKQ